MQYILTQEEFDFLQKQAKRGREAPTDEDLQKLCTRMADEMPVAKRWLMEGAPLSPWGCIITTDTEYCDDCPARAICPNKYKIFSK